jgi:hypothetical protein
MRRGRELNAGVGESRKVGIWGRVQGAIRIRHIAVLVPVVHYCFVCKVLLSANTTGHVITEVIQTATEDVGLSRPHIGCR